MEVGCGVAVGAEHAVGIAIFSYNGGMVLGLGADCDSTPDLHVLAEGVERGFAELDMLFRGAAPKPPTKHSSSKRKPTPSPTRTPTAGARRA